MPCWFATAVLLGEHHDSVVANGCNHLWGSSAGEEPWVGQIKAGATVDKAVQAGGDRWWGNSTGEEPLVGQYLVFDFAIHKIPRQGRSMDHDHDVVYVTGSIKRPCFQSFHSTVESSEGGIYR